MNSRSAARPESLESAASSGVAGALAPACTGAVCAAADLAFDVGTSPHGLSADLPISEQETHEPSSGQPPAKPLLTFSLTEDQRDHLAFAATCQIETLEEGYEVDELEVQEAMRDLYEAHCILKGVTP